MSAAQDARAPDSAATGWRAMVTGERLPRFALICVGMWLTAADTLMTATIMPSVAADIGGYAWFGWAVAIFMLGSILAGATSGQLSKRIGLRTAMAVAGLVYAIGCALSAAAPNIAAFLVGRFAQGIGGGWVVGLCYVAVSSLFPQPLWPRVFSAISGVWGVATLLSPLIGGLFAQAGHWRAAFWLFAAQGLAFIAAAAVLVTRNAAPAEDSIEHAPLAQLAPLSLGVVAIAAAGLVASPFLAAGLGAAGLALVALFLRMDLRAAASLLPRTSADPRGGVGAGLAMIFLLSVATASFTAYGPAIMQTLFGLSPIQAGYTLGAEAAAWTIVALVFASLWRPSAKIRVGAVAVGLGVAALAYVMPRGPVAAIVGCAVLLGGGFGLNWAMLAERIVANAAPDEQSLAASSVPTTQMIGTAVGAAAAGAIANLIGFAGGIDRAKALAGGFWLFAAFVPVAALGMAAAWRLAAAQFDPKPAGD
jgi:MFS family permease